MIARPLPHPQFTKSSRARELRLPWESGGIAELVRAGLSGMPKSLPPKLFYDARGSELFDEITRLPEYYLTRTELGILSENAREIAECVGANVSVIELGAGSAEKTPVILEAVLRRQLRLAYVPIDVSEEALQFAKRRLRAQFKRVHVRPVVADYTSDLSALRAVRGRKLVLYIGSSIGNFSAEDSARTLSQLRQELAPGDALLLGTDLRKEECVLVAAYDDAAGVTAQFNKNVLARINRELGGRFDLDRFRHVAAWNAELSAMQMFLQSVAAQRVEISALGMQVDFAEGERIHTENSFKYTQGAVESLLSGAGLQRERTWTDAKSWYAVHLARVR